MPKVKSSILEKNGVKMGIFDWIFKKKEKNLEIEKAEEEKNKFNLDEIEKIISSSKQEILKELIASFHNSFGEISSQISSLNKSLSKLESENFEGQKVDPRLLRILLDNKSNFVIRVRGLIRKLQERPDENSDSVEKYFSNAQTEISSVISDTEINRLKMSEFMSSKLSPVTRKINYLADFLVSEKNKLPRLVGKIKLFDELLNKENILKNIIGNAKSKKIEIEQIREELESLKDKKDSKEKELSKIMQSEEYTEYLNAISEKAELSSEIKQVESDFINYLSVLNKPYKKFLNLVERGKIKFLDAKNLESFLENMSLDNKSIEIIHESISELKSSIEKDHLELKEDVKKKSLNKIDEILNGGDLKNFLQTKENLEREMEKIEARAKNFDQNKKKGIEAEISSLDERVSGLSESLSELESDLKDFYEKFGTVKNELEAGIKNSLEREITIETSLPETSEKQYPK